MSTLRASRAILLLSLRIKSNPQSEITFVTNLLSLKSSVLHSKLRYKTSLEKHFYPGGIQLTYIDVFSVECLKNNPNMEITNSYHQYVANHKRLRRYRCTVNAARIHENLIKFNTQKASCRYIEPSSSNRSLWKAAVHSYSITSCAWIYWLQLSGEVERRTFDGICGSLLKAWGDVKFTMELYQH